MFFIEPHIKIEVHFVCANINILCILKLLEISLVRLYVWILILRDFFNAVSAYRVDRP